MFLQPIGRALIPKRQGAEGVATGKQIRSTMSFIINIIIDPHLHCLFSTTDKQNSQISIVTPHDTNVEPGKWHQLALSMTTAVRVIKGGTTTQLEVMIPNDRGAALIALDNTFLIIGTSSYCCESVIDVWR